LSDLKVGDAAPDFSLLDENGLATTDALLNLMSDRNHGVDDLYPECAVELRLSIIKGRKCHERPPLHSYVFL
jgi:hypothetical protein